MQTLKGSFSLAAVVVLGIFFNSAAFGQGFPPTVCPLTLQVVALQATVSTGNTTELRDAIVNATAIPVIDATGVCSDVVPIAEGISTGDISEDQVNAYRNQIQKILIPLDKVFAFKWQRQNGDTFITLGVTDRNDTPKFEPIITWESGLLLEFSEVAHGISGGSSSGSGADPQALTSNTLTTKVAQDTKLGTTGYSAIKKITVFTQNGRTIQDESETISFISGLFWEVAATKVPTKIKLGCIECKKVVSTITFVTGFKSLKISAGGGGYSGSVEVEGRLGANGQYSETDIMCADGKAFHDGTPVK